VRTIPPGADAVVMQEDCEAVQRPDGAAVRIQRVPALGLNIRRAGEDVTRGAVVLSKGERACARFIGAGGQYWPRSFLPVAAPPRVALFSTGDELVMPGTMCHPDMKPGAIYNSNRFFLRALLLRLGCDVRTWASCLTS
jgi:molybdopterin molybdotransferase